MGHAERGYHNRKALHLTLVSQTTGFSAVLSNDQAENPQGSEVS